MIDDGEGRTDNLFRYLVIDQSDCDVDDRIILARSVMFALFKAYPPLMQTDELVGDGFAIELFENGEGSAEHLTRYDVLIGGDLSWTIYFIGPVDCRLSTTAHFEEL